MLKQLYYLDLTRFDNKKWHDNFREPGLFAYL